MNSLTRITIVAVTASFLFLQGCNVVQFNRRLISVKFEDEGLRHYSAKLSSGTINYYIGGQGFPVLFLHGFGGSALENWENQVGEFIRSYRVITPDIYWFGDSKPTPTAKMETAAQQADAMAELLRSLGIGPAHVVGLSFGGFIAIELARRHPQLVKRLVLVDSAGLRYTDEEQAQTSRNFDGVKNVNDLLVPKNVAMARKLLEGVMYDDPWLPSFVLKLVLKNEFWVNRKAKTRILNGMQNGGLLRESDFHAIKHRSLLIWGKHDPLILPSIGRRMAKALPNATFVQFDESAHTATLEEPQRFNRVVLKFLAQP